jgi:hypothetical protein
MTCLPIQSNSDARLERVRFFRVEFLMPQPSCGTGFQSIELSAKDIAQMPRMSIDIQDPHHVEMQHYEGVRLSDLLAKAGVPMGDKLRGRTMAMYVLAQASDGYAVVYSVAGLDPAIHPPAIFSIQLRRHLRPNGAQPGIAQALQSHFAGVVPNHRVVADQLKNSRPLSVTGFNFAL